MKKLILICLLSVVFIKKAHATVLSTDTIKTSIDNNQVLIKKINQFNTFFFQAKYLLDHNFSYTDASGVTITYGPYQQYLFWKQYDQYINDLNNIIGDYPPMTASIPPWGVGPQPANISAAGTQ